MAQMQQWARLQTDINNQLRRGAWYPVLRLSATEAVIEVSKGKPTPISRTLLHITPAPGRTWTVVPRPTRAVRLPASWGSSYGVCPNCRNRAPLDNHPAQLRCQRCNGIFDVAWEEHYLATA